MHSAQAQTHCRLGGQIIDLLGNAQRPVPHLDSMSGRRNRVNVELPITLRAIGQRLAVRRPAVEVRRAVRSYELGRAACNREDVDPRLAILLRLVAVAQLGPVRRNAVVVVAANGKAAIDRLRFAATGRNTIDSAAAVADMVARFRRLDQLTRGLSKEIQLVERADDPMLHVERQEYLTSMRKVRAGMEDALVMLAKAKQRIVR